MPRESSIVSRICANLKRRGVWHKKNHGSQYSRKGEPDIEVMIPTGTPGIVRKFYFEIKRHGCRPTPLQEYRLKELQQAGAIAMVARSWEEVLAALNL